MHWLRREDNSLGAHYLDTTVTLFGKVKLGEIGGHYEGEPGFCAVGGLKNRVGTGFWSIGGIGRALEALRQKKETIRAKGWSNKSEGRVLKKKTKQGGGKDRDKVRMWSVERKANGGALTKKFHKIKKGGCKEKMWQSEKKGEVLEKPGGGGRRTLFADIGD